MEEIVSFEPATGLELWRAPLSDIDNAVALAQEAWPNWAAQSLSVRIEFVRRFANEVRANADTLAMLAARETGTLLDDAHDEIDAVIARIDTAARAYSERSPQRRHDSALQGTSAIRHKPHGVIAAITPFAGSLQTVADHVIPPLIAGNTVLLKPSEKAPATAEALVRCFHQANLPDNVLQTVVGGPQAGIALANQTGVNGVLFTGSRRAGAAIGRIFAEHPGRLCSLHMGGNNPIVVWDTPKLTDAAALVVQSAFAGAGQRCTAARRLIVHDTIADALLEEVARLVDRLICGNPMDEPKPFMGPVISNASADHLIQAYLDLISSGARVIRHLIRLDQDRPFLQPGIIDVTTIHAPDEELFGPILQLTRVSDFDQAIHAANRTRFGLSAALVGGSPEHYNRFWANIHAGVINWNRPTTTIASNSPFGGVGLSGNFHPGGLYAADSSVYPVASGEMLQPRALIGSGLKAA